jgi:hypothetical protein
MAKIAGSGSVSQRHRSADPNPDPDPDQNVMGPQHCSKETDAVPDVRSPYTFWRHSKPKMLSFSLKKNFWLSLCCSLSYLAIYWKVKTTGTNTYIIYSLLSYLIDNMTLKGQ